MPFTNSTQVDPVTIPETAGPGDARIVIGSVLPPPLDTFLVTTTSGDYPYTVGIVIYGEGDDSRFEYIAVVPDPVVSGRFETHWGAVFNGAVVEENNGLSGGYPQAFKMRLPNAANLTAEFTAQTFAALADQAVSIFSRNNSITLSAILGAVIVQANQFSVENFQVSGSHGWKKAQITGSYSKSDSAFADFPETATVTIFKTMNSSLTNIKVRFEPSCFVDVADTGPEFAVKTGSTDYSTRDFPGGHVISHHMVVPGVVIVTGLGEGSHTFTARWRRSSGTGSVHINTEDEYSLEAWEVSTL